MPPTRAQARRRPTQPRQPAQPPNENRGITRAEEEDRKMRELVTAVAARTEQLESLLAGQMDRERFVTVALQAIQSQPALLACSKLSLLAAIRDSATYGLEPAGILGDAAIVPYDGIATLQIQYRGLRKLALRDGTVAAIDADIVYERDAFDFESGSQPRIVHKPSLEADRGNYLGAYAWARFRNGELVVLWMPLAELLKRRDASRSFRKAEKDGTNNSVWHLWGPEMMKKTVLKRLETEKLPLTPVAREALTIDTMADTSDALAVRQTVTAAPAGSDARTRLMARMGLAQLPSGPTGQPPDSPRPEAGAGQPAAQPASADADGGTGQNGAPGASVAAAPAKPPENGQPEAALELCGAQSPHNAGETCRKPKGHETIDEPGAVMHRSSSKETWQ